MGAPLKKSQRLAHFPTGLSSIQASVLVAQIRGVGLGSIIPQDECGQLYCPPDIEERTSYDGLTRFITIYDPAPAKCSECGCNLYPRSGIDCSGLTAEEMQDLTWEMENIRSVSPCTAHIDAGVIWAPQIEVTYRVGEPGATIEITQNRLPANPLLVSREGLQLLSKVLVCLESWIEKVQEAIAANANRDHGDEAAPLGGLWA